MKKSIVLLFVALSLPVMLFASEWQKIEEFDEFGDSTGKSEIVLSNQSGTYNSVSGGIKNGKLVWECHSIPNGDSYIILKENDRDVNLSTAKFKSDTFTIKIKSDFGTVKEIKGHISLNGSSYNAIMLEDSYVFQSLIASNKSPKIVVSCDNGEGSYSLGTVSSESFKELVFEKSVYDQANNLIREQKFTEAQSLLKKFKVSNANGYKFLNCDFLAEKCPFGIATNSYNEAVSLMDQGKYQEALSVLMSLKVKDKISYDKLDGYAKVLECKKILGIYDIGDFGPAGGYIFYDKGFYSDGWRYLEAAPRDLNATFKWGDYDKYGTMTAVGTGKNNTEKIVKNASKSTTYNAAVYCTNYSVNGYDDWFLPSKDELNLMYVNLKKNGLGGFAKEYYWSSSEIDNDNAWHQDFYNGNQYGNCRSISNSYIRPVRAF